MKTVKRPWGFFKQFCKNKKCTVKVLVINPKQSLSLQKHKHRDEEWYFLTDGYVEIGDKERKVKKGDRIWVEDGTKHRVFSKGKKVEFLEISYGKFSEKDEIRLEDKYGRS
jgi:mannose-1-phosphate guanylyltransferase/mannose-6-phosphate isomerase